MPSVQEELEALRSRGVAKKNASKLKDASGLSTPEAEQNAIKKEAERTSLANYGKEAGSTLKAYNDAKVVVQNREGTTDSGPSKTPTKNDAATSTAEKDDKNQDDDDDDVPLLEEVPELEEIPSMGGGGGGGVEGEAGAAVSSGPPATRDAGTINRAERKARRMMEKLGMKKATGISQVVIKMSEGGGRGGVYTIATPDVYEKNGSYVVFGEARQGGGAGGASAAAPAANGDQITQAQQAEAIQQLAAMAKSGGGANATGGDVNEPLKIEEITDEEAAVDDSGLDGKDIDLVITQAGCSRAKAVKALKENDGDLVNAIMSLTA